MTARDTSLPPWVVLGYGLGASGLGLILTVPALFVAYYLAELRHVVPVAMAAGLLLPQALDYLSGPFIGAMSDRSGRFGRKRLMAAGCALSGLAATALFAAPAEWTPTGALIWTAFAFAVLVLGATLFHLPHLALAAELVGTPRDRVRLVAARMACALGGVLLGGTLAQPLLQAGGGGIAAYARLSLVLGVTAALFMATALAAVQGREVHRAVPAEPVYQSLRGVAEDGPFLGLAASYLLQSLGAGLSLAAWPFYAAEVLHEPATVSLLFGVSMALSLASFAVWPVLARRLGRNAAYCLAVGVFALGAAGLVLMGANQPRLGEVLIAAMLSGFATGGLQLLPFAALADHLAASRDAGRTGIVTGIWVTGEKFGLAAGAALLGGILGAAGGLGRGEAIVLAASLVPLTLYFASAAVLLMNSTATCHQHGNSIT